ncbi:non-canonical purine NTP pyrophosphatase, partial [Escherichia coli]|uniref:non-canonical purine NTP pyrophosphatase n=1 Tax=Escherichia coli TaxID=562 RepID=UPI002573D99B
MLELVFASANQGKIKEIHQILGHSFVINGLRDVGIVEEIPETGQTFFENAFQKANYVYQKCGCNVFADDSGLVVSALNGEPGVHSAIYAGYP